jgi:hypothetical protein
MIQEQPEVISFYVPYLNFCENTSRFIAENFIEPKVKEFFYTRKIDKYDLIDTEKYISDLDFKKVSFSYFYENILADIEKQSGNVHHIIKYGITFDEEVTPETCEKTKIKYDEILLNKKPIFYFIYVDLKEMMSFLRKQDRQRLKQM